MTKKIFINYRVEEGRQEAQRLYHCLRLRFKKSQLFMAEAHLEGGQAWLDAIDQHVAESFAMAALIGPDWLNRTDKNGTVRLNQPSDPVRFEIASALRRKIPVIPVLLEDAKLPDELQLPLEIRGMLAWHAMPLRFGSFDEDAEKLAEALKRHIPKRKASIWALGATAAASVVVGGGAGFGGAALLMQDAVSAVRRAQIAEGRVQSLESELISARAAKDATRQATLAPSEKSAVEKAVRQEEEAKRRQAVAVATADAERRMKAELAAARRDVEAARRKAESDTKLIADRDAAIEQRDRDLITLRRAQRASLAVSTPSDAIRALQQRLHRQGYYNGAIDGIAGQRLYRAMSSAFVAQGSAGGQAENEQVSKFRDLLEHAGRDQSKGTEAFIQYVMNLADRTSIPSASATQRPTLEDIKVSYSTREAPRDGSFPFDGDQVEYRLALSGPSFDRLVILDNSLNIQQVELCKQPCTEVARNQKWILNRDHDDFRNYGGKFIFRTDDGRVNTAARSTKGSDTYPDFDDVMYLRLTQRKNMPKSYAISLIYRRQ